jgi:adenosine deaminase
MDDSELIRRLPKAELHCHLDGSVRVATLLELGKAMGSWLPSDDVAGLRTAMRVPDACTLEAYLSSFSVTLGVLQTADALERVAYELAEDNAREGVWYLEVRFAPILNTRLGLSQADVVRAVARGLRRAERETGIVARIIVCALRQLGPSSSMEAARFAAEHRGEMVVGFDLAGAEAGHAAGLHAPAFRYARESGFSCTCHAGEADGPESIRQAIELCGATRIGHGTRLIDDAALVASVAERGIPLEVCLTSNVQTGATPSYAAHPLGAYVRAGVPTVLCTDNRLMSDTTVTAEYGHAQAAQGLTVRELAAIARAGYEYAFLPEAERGALLARFDAAVAGITAQGGPHGGQS